MLGVTLLLAGAAGFAPGFTASRSPYVAIIDARAAMSPIMFSGGSSSAPKRVAKTPAVKTQAKKAVTKGGKPTESPSQLFERLASPFFVPPSRPDLKGAQPTKKIVKKPVTRKPVTTKQVATKAVVKKPVAKKPVAKTPAAKKPAAKKPAARQAVVGRVVPTKPIVKKFADPAKQAAATRAGFEKRQAAEFKKRQQLVGRVVPTKLGATAAKKTASKTPTFTDPAKQAAAIRAAYEKREKAEFRSKAYRR
jgi:hypothetical protein